MKKTSRIARLSLVFALSLILNLLESFITVFAAFPGVKPGLSNLPVMFCLICENFSVSVTLTVAKALFVFLTRGFSASVLSLAGGILSAASMALLLKLSKRKISLTAVSITGGVIHNAAQLAVCALLWGTVNVFLLSPILIMSGVVFGLVNAVLLKNTLPYLKRIGGKS